MDRLITMGHRARSQRTPVAGRILATLPKNTTFETQDELEAYWKKQIDDVPQEHFVDAVNDDGIFASTLRVQVEQITKLGHAYGLSTGLGYVRLDGKYPCYNFGDSESDVTVALADPRKFNARRWWGFITGLQNLSLVDILRDTIEDGDRLIVSISPEMISFIVADLAILAKGDELPLGDVKKVLRLIGNGLEDRCPAALLDCVMPYDAAVDRVVVGTRPTRNRRIAYLLTKVAPNSDDPIADYKAVRAYMDAADSPVLKYASAPTFTKKAASNTLDDAQLRKLITTNYMDRCHGLPERIARVMRADGYRVEHERINEVVASLSKKPKVAKAADGGSGKKAETKADEKAADAAKKSKTTSTNGASNHA